LVLVPIFAFFFPHPRYFGIGFWNNGNPTDGRQVLASSAKTAFFTYHFLVMHWKHRLVVIDTLPRRIRLLPLRVVFKSPFVYQLAGWIFLAATLGRHC
jgi:hypothetical protein